MNILLFAPALGFVLAAAQGLKAAVINGIGMLAFQVNVDVEHGDEHEEANDRRHLDPSRAAVLVSRAQILSHESFRILSQIPLRVDSQLAFPPVGHLRIVSILNIAAGYACSAAHCRHQ